VRAGSVKRVAGALGEGAQVVAALQAFLGETGSAEIPAQGRVLA
jgi:thioredoxin reductase (NADPH)